MKVLDLGFKFKGWFELHDTLGIFFIVKNILSMYIFYLYFMNCYTIYLNRHIKFFFIFFSLFLYSFNSNSHPQDYIKFKSIEMEVLRNGKVIGFSKYYFNHKDQFLEIKNETEFEVKLVGVKIFEIKSEGIERYDNNNLISYNSKTLQNDKKKFVNLEGIINHLKK